MIARAEQAAAVLAALWAILLSLQTAGAADRVNRVTTVPVPDRGRPVAAKTDAEGTIHLLYDSADGPQYVKSTDKGKTFSPAIPVVDEGSRKPGLEFHGSDMAVGKGNRVHVAMSTNACASTAQYTTGFLAARPALTLSAAAGHGATAARGLQSWGA